MARGKQVTSYVPADQVEAFEKMLEEDGLTSYLMVAKLIENELKTRGYVKKPEVKGLDTSMLSTALPVPVRRRRRHARRQG